MSRLIDLVNAGKWRELFIEELGWSLPSLKPVMIPLPEPDEEYEVVCAEVAQYKGIRVWLCRDLLDARTQRYVDKEIKNYSTERLIIFAGETEQVWRWPQSSDNHGRGKTRLLSHRHTTGRENEALEQRLAMIEIKVTESPSIIEVLRRLRAAFDADRITKAFYDKFSKRHEALVRAIDGLPVYEPEKTIEDKKTKNQERKWYSSLLLNRLMFIYFLQRKGFMDNDRNYLGNRLHQVKEMRGEGRFFEFYSDFLIPMFHNGLGEPGLAIKDPAIKTLVGDIPYINGGIFAVHELESTYGNIHIADEVFQEIFSLFDGYQWHLDDRPTGNPNEINPDVLGHIFEQFINQKQMGAYYTKEDVTHFMTSSTLLPVLLERIQKQVGSNPWSYVSAEPTRYVWESVSYGLDIEYPEKIRDQAESVRRPSWNEKAPDEWALPGETWWEVDRRHRNYERIVVAAQAGEINTADASVTANIDLETLALDVIDGLDTPGDVVEVWNILSDLKVVDPTCGSGAFLFAALKILLDLYDAILDAARAHAVTSNEKSLTDLVAEADSHPNQHYYILKHATLHNLYGVDIMKEATEIARLRLFLKLVAAIDSREDLEPLPDLDFSIKPGNILVGAHTVDEVADAADLISQQDVLDQAKAAGEVVADAYETFREVSEVGDEKAIKIARKSLSSALTSARMAINRTYFGGQSVGMLTLDEWVQTHVPFHWFIEFPEVFANGGFDVVIGNPPYIAKSRVTAYKFTGFKTTDLPDIYAPCTERASQITRADGRMSLIIPISAQFGNEYVKLRSCLEKRFGTLWVSAFQERPAALFQVKLRNTILIGAGTGGVSGIHSTLTHSWVDHYRSHLFPTLSYSWVPLETHLPNWPRTSGEAMTEMLEALASRGNLSASLTARSQYTVGFKKTATYFLTAYTKSPITYDVESHAPVPLNEGVLAAVSREDQLAVCAVLNSKLGFLWWSFTGDCFNVTKSTMSSVPVAISSLTQDQRARLVSLGASIEEALPSVRSWDRNAGKYVGGYAIPELRRLTDQVDVLLAEASGVSGAIEELEYAHARMFNSGGASATTVRVLPWLRGGGSD